MFNIIIRNDENTYNTNNSYHLFIDQTKSTQHTSCLKIRADSNLHQPVPMPRKQYQCIPICQTINQLYGQRP